MTPPGQLADLSEFRGQRRLYVLPRWKLVYVSVPKNACTSIKWLVAELAGEDLGRLRRGALGFAPTREGQIHDRDLWQHATRPHRLGRQLWQRVVEEGDWHVFGVIRDPRLRLFSAWQDKYLLRSPGYWRHWERHPSPVPRTPQDVVGAFREFCLEVAADPQHAALDDGHFVTQVHALKEHVVPYRRLYDMSELGEMMRDLNTHLAGLGHPGDLVLGRSNSSPFSACGPLFADGVREAIEKVYADDFARFGDRWDFSAVEARPLSWTAESFAHAHTIIAVNERVADVVRTARRLRRRNRRLRRRNAALQARLHRRSGRRAARGLRRLRPAAGRVKRRLARAVRG